MNNFINSIEKNEKKQNFGKILEDEQYTDPNHDPKNKITSSFEVSLKTQLTDSLIFNEECSIVKSWYKKFIAIGLVLVVHGNENPFQHILVCKFRI